MSSKIRDKRLENIADLRLQNLQKAKYIYSCFTHRLPKSHKVNVIINGVSLIFNFSDMFLPLKSLPFAGKCNERKKLE